MVKNIRMLSQELVTPQFNKSKDLVAWMGAVQAQDIVMSKWAVGVRLKTPSLADIEQALAAGEIVRTHVLRPTWHMVAAEDIRWMLALTGKRIKAACASWGKSYGVDEQLYPKCCKQLEKLLANGQHLTKTEIGERLMQEKAIENEVQMSCLLSLAEAEGLVCNGVERNKKHTYALLDERVPLCKELTKEEALATLARKYFRSHSPASLQDFVWWSGLTMTEAKLGIKYLAGELICDRFAEESLYLHESYANCGDADDMLHLLPPYDEFLISYKSRNHVLAEEHNRKAFNTFGIFYPVIVCNGRIVGNWKKATKKGGLSIEFSLFPEHKKVTKKALRQAEERYRAFLGDSALEV